MRRLAVLAALVAAISATLVGPAGAAKPRRAAGPAATSLAHLRADVKALSHRAASRRLRRALAGSAALAGRQAKGRPCSALKSLTTFERRLRGVRSRAARAALKADLLGARAGLLVSPGATRCGGAKPTTTSRATPKLLRSDERQMTLRLALPAPTFTEEVHGGRTFAAMHMDGLGENRAVGKPGVPALTRLFGVPDGADVSVKVTGQDGYDLPGVDLLPHQASPVDLKLPKGAPPASTFADPPFKLDGKAYKSDEPYPAKPAQTDGLGDLRGVQIRGLELAGGQYETRRHRLHVFTSLTVDVTFGGANKGDFGQADPWDAYFDTNLSRLLDTRQAVIDHRRPPVRVALCGEDMLIVTTPPLQPAAQAFAAYKQTTGFQPLIALTGSGSGQIGTTEGQIQAYIRSQLTSSCPLRPQFVVLIGGIDQIPTFHVKCSPAQAADDPCDIASDLPYSLNGIGSDLFADVELGRLPGADLAQAQGVVNKIITYESTPPAPEGDDFYRHATVTSYFQPSTPCYLNAGASGTPNCDPNAGPVNGHNAIDYANHRDVRGFTKTAETVRRAMVAKGYAVDRVYTTDNSSVVPEQYYDGTDNRVALRRPVFGWAGTCADLLGDYQAGRFLILHRDHGWPDGWAAPDLTSGDVGSLTNGAKLPVVFGVNCASGMYDRPGNPGFVERQVLKPDGGAFAGFGDTRNSPSFPNNHMTFGFFDALFPGLEPAFGSSTPTRRLGDVLLSGKAFMATQEGIDWQGSGDTYVEHYLYNLLGDPSGQMWAAPPRDFRLGDIPILYEKLTRVDPGDPPFKVHVELGGRPEIQGTVLTLYSHGQAIGRAVAGGDSVDIVPAGGGDAPDDLTVAFNQDGYVPGSARVQGVPDQTPPPPPPVATKLSWECPPNGVSFGKPYTFKGHLDPALAGAKVSLSFTTTGKGAPFSASVSTDANGDFTYDRTFARADAGQWEVKVAYAGDAGPAAASTVVCAFAVTP